MLDVVALMDVLSKQKQKQLGLKELKAEAEYFLTTVADVSELVFKIDKKHLKRSRKIIKNVVGNGESV